MQPARSARATAQAIVKFLSEDLESDEEEEDDDAEGVESMDE